jgi:hypothetical protein
MALDHFHDYRVVVRARTASRREFIWQIIRNYGADERAVRKSIRAFKSMEEAYASGAAALKSMIRERLATRNSADSDAAV